MTSPRERHASISSTGSRGSMVGMRKLSFSVSDDQRPYLEQPIPDVPDDGIRIRVCFAGLCYFPSINASPLRKGCPGFRNGNVFEGFEISGSVDAVGDDVESNDLCVGAPVVVFPDEEITSQGYSDFVVVRKLQNVVKLPLSISLAAGAMLPTGGTLAMSAVLCCQKYLDRLIAAKGHCNVMIFGAGSLTHWLIRLLRYTNLKVQDRIHIIVASDDWQGLKTAQKSGAEEVITLDENCHEDALVDRLCGSVFHGVNMAICLAQDERMHKRAARCLSAEGILVVPESLPVETGDLQEGKQFQVVEVPSGNVETLRMLVDIIDQEKSLQQNIPAYKVYPVASSQKVYDDLQYSDEVVHERPVLDFENTEADV